MNEYTITLYDLKQKLLRMYEQGATDSTEICIRVYSSHNTVIKADTVDVKMLRGSSANGKSKIAIEGKDYSWTI